MIIFLSGFFERMDFIIIYHFPHLIYLKVMVTVYPINIISLFLTLSIPQV